MSGPASFGGRGVLLVIAAIVVAIAIAAGLWAAGSPGESRARRLDERRLRDLQAIAQAADRYRLDHGRLPASLEELVAGSRWTLATVDPERHEPYGYRALDDSTYELCTTYAFALEASAEFPRERRWLHSAGPYCHRLVAERDPKLVPLVPDRAYPGGD